MKPKCQHMQRPPTAEKLQQMAERYLARFAASEASVRRVLTNRLCRIALLNKEFAADRSLQAQLKTAIETIIEHYKKCGILNDAAYADMKRNRLRRAGRSEVLIKRSLQIKGIDNETIMRSFAQENSGEDLSDPEAMAAQKFAQRKKFGRYALKPIDQVQRKKQIAAMARAGFRFQMIKQVLGESDDDALPVDED